MTSPSEHVPLHDSVERLLEHIYSEQKQTPPSSQVRRELVNIGEELAVDILKLISQVKIRSSLFGFIMHIIRSQTSVRSRSRRRHSVLKSPLSGPGLNTADSDSGSPSLGSGVAAALFLVLKEGGDGGSLEEGGRQ